MFCVACVCGDGGFIGPVAAAATQGDAIRETRSGGRDQGGERIRQKPPQTQKRSDLHGVLAGPFSGCGLVFGSISFVEMGDFWNKGIIWVSISQ